MHTRQIQLWKSNHNNVLQLTHIAYYIIRQYQVTRTRKLWKANTEV